MAQAIGFIGAGQMGEPMVKRLVSGGYPVTVFARRPAVRQRLACAGAQLAGSIAELAAGSDVLLTCVFSDVQLREIGAGPDGFVANAKPGAIIVSHTTGTVETLKVLAAQASSSATILDAPVSGTASDIEAGKLTVLIGGPALAVEQATPPISTYASNIISTGELGSALHIKLLNNMLFAANIQLASAAAAVGRQLGVESSALLHALQVCSGGSRAAEYMNAVGDLAIFTQSVVPFLRKDITAATSAADELGIDLGLLSSVVRAGPLPLATPAD